MRKRQLGCVSQDPNKGEGLRDTQRGRPIEGVWGKESHSSAEQG